VLLFSSRLDVFSEIYINWWSKEIPSSDQSVLRDYLAVMGTEEVESLEEVDLGKAIHTEYCGMARSVLRIAETRQLSFCFSLD
jgi:hypothetical protein